MCSDNCPSTLVFLRTHCLLTWVLSGFYTILRLSPGPPLSGLPKILLFSSLTATGFCFWKLVRIYGICPSMNWCISLTVPSMLLQRTEFHLLWLNSIQLSLCPHHWWTPNWSGCSECGSAATLGTLTPLPFTYAHPCDRWLTRHFSFQFWRKCSPFLYCGYVIFITIT